MIIRNKENCIFVHQFKLFSLEVEEEIKIAIGKIIDEINILFDEDGMDQLYMKFSDNSELFLKNNKRKNSDDFRIYTEEDYSQFEGAKVENIALEDDFFSEDIFDSEIQKIVILTDKGTLNVCFENEGFDNNLNIASLITFLWVLN